MKYLSIIVCMLAVAAPVFAGGLVVVDDATGRLNGVWYDRNEPRFIEHHAGQGESVYWIDHAFTVPEPDANGTYPLFTAWANDNFIVYTDPADLRTPLEFRQLFTVAERGTISMAGDTNATVRAIVDDFEAAQEIDLSSPLTVQAVFALSEFGFFNATRRDCILAGISPEVCP